MLVWGLGGTYLSLLCHQESLNKVCLFLSGNCTTQEFKAIKSALLREDNFTGIDKLPSQSLKVAGRHGQSLLDAMFGAFSAQETS